MFISLEHLCRQIEGIQAIVLRCAEEKWIRIVEKQGVHYVTKTDAYRLRYIFHLLNSGVAWEHIPDYLTPGHLYSVEIPDER